MPNLYLLWPLGNFLKASSSTIPKETVEFAAAENRKFIEQIINLEDYIVELDLLFHKNIVQIF